MAVTLFLKSEFTGLLKKVMRNIEYTLNDQRANIAKPMRFIKIRLVYNFNLK